MSQYDEEQRVIKRYLLGELELEQQQQVEQRLFIEDEYFEALLIGEDEIIDEYLSGSLTAPEQERFVNFFLSAPERRQKLSFARTLGKYIKAASEPARETQTSSSNAQSPVFWKRFVPFFLRERHPAFGFSLAAALLLLVLGVTWVVLKTLRPQNRRGTENPNAVLAVTLTPGALRGAGTLERVIIPNHVELVRLQLKLPTDEYQSYSATLLTIGGQEIFTADELKAEKMGTGKVVSVNIPAIELKGGDYQLNLRGLDTSGRFEGVGRYYFRVVKSPQLPESS